MKVLAEMIGDLNYSTMEDLFYELYLKLNRDSMRDRYDDKIKLADSLAIMSDHLEQASLRAAAAYEISKPFMQKEKGK